MTVAFVSLQIIVDEQRQSIVLSVQRFVREISATTEAESTEGLIVLDAEHDVSIGDGVETRLERDIEPLDARHARRQIDADEKRFETFDRQRFGHPREHSIVYNGHSVVHLHVLHMPSGIHQTRDRTIGIDIEELHASVVILEPVDVSVNLMQFLRHAEAIVRGQVVRWFGVRHFRIVRLLVANRLDLLRI